MTRKLPMGIGVALVTPFKEDLSIDYDSLKRVVKHVTDGGVDYLVVLGTTGETSTLTYDERSDVLNFIVEHNTENLPIVYGIGGNNTQSVINSINKCDFTHIDAVLSVCPYYNKPSQRGIIEHYTQIAEASPVPIILYNVPGRTGVNISAETILKLSNHPNIGGVKEANTAVEQICWIAGNKPSDFDLISGDDLNTLNLMAMGGTGAISVLANAYPTVFKTLKDSMLGGDIETARTALFQLNKINSLMYTEGNPTGIKQLLSHLGLCEPWVRPPMYHASTELSQAIKGSLI